MSIDASSDRRPQATHGEAGRAREAVVMFPDEVVFANARSALEQALAGLDGEPPRFDLSACQRFDSSLIGVLLELSRRASDAGRRCAFTGASANLRKLAGLYGVDGLLFGGNAGHGATAVCAEA